MLTSTKTIKRILLQPVLWTSLASIVAYWDAEALRGAFVYDDNGSIKSNVVVNGQVPFREVSLSTFYYCITDYS
jgi:hypothetical protein